MRFLKILGVLLLGGFLFFAGERVYYLSNVAAANVQVYQFMAQPVLGADNKPILVEGKPLTYAGALDLIVKQAARNSAPPQGGDSAKKN